MSHQVCSSLKNLDSVIGPSHSEEVQKFHSRLLRLSLAISDCRAYWENWQEDISEQQKIQTAFEGRWFGNKSMARIQTLLNNFTYRFDAYPIALKVLSAWCPSDPVTRQNICHWHLQLSDPLYRCFSDQFLEQRRANLQEKIDRDVVVRWLSGQIKAEWSINTRTRMATALITCATTAGLCSEGIGSRQLQYPKVTDEALSYWLYFLRYLSFEGSLFSNPYWRSLGLRDEMLEKRFRRLGSLQFQRMGELEDFGWQYPDLWAMAQAELIRDRGERV